MKMVRCTLGGMLIIISMCILLVFVGALVLPNFEFTVRNIVFDLLGMSVFCITGFYLVASCLETRIEQERLMQCSVAMVFFTYVAVLGLLLMTNSMLVEDKSKVIDYRWQDYVQFVPFHTMFQHIKLLIQQKTTFLHEFSQVCEHLLKFGPLGLILPFIYNKCTNTFSLVRVATLAILAYGMLELSLRAGIQDIDYLFLNILGVYLSYRLLNCRFMQRLLWKLYIVRK